MFILVFAWPGISLFFSLPTPKSEFFWVLQLVNLQLSLVIVV